MGYNTRRKSLSLTELGIVLPKRQRTQSHPSPPSTIAEGDESERPSKKTRWMSPPPLKEVKPKPAATLSPPPSPAAEGRNKVDVEGIGDDIVVGTIQQLEQTGNRPHLVKELATVLATNLHCVEKSANPSALISSRLTAYLNRPWPAISPCPLAKDLSPVHPRRLYFYLTTLPRQPIPDTVNEPPKASRIISPSLSSASAADEEEVVDRYGRGRHTLSPSPEVDLSSPELDDDAPHQPPTPGAPFSGRNSVARERSASASHPTVAAGRRGGSPQLEHEERDFKQTANALYEQAQERRRNSQQSQTQPDVKMEGADAVAGAAQEKNTIAVSIEQSHDEVLPSHADDEETAALFGQPGGGLKLMGVEGVGMFSSPLMQPQNMSPLDHTLTGAGAHGNVDAMSLDDASAGAEKDAHLLSDWDTLKSPENVELAELDDLFDAY